MIQLDQPTPPTETNPRGEIKNREIDTRASGMEAHRKYITRKEAAERFNLCIRKIDLLIEDGTLPAARISKRCIRIPIDRADRAIDAMGKEGAK